MVGVDSNTHPVDSRGLAHSYAYIGIKRLGAGQFYLINIKDRTATVMRAARPTAYMCRPMCRSSHSLSAKSGYGTKPTSMPTLIRLLSGVMDMAGRGGAIAKRLC